MKELFGFLSLVLFLLVACAPKSDSGDTAASVPPPPPVEEPKGPDGEKVYKTYCVACHGIDGAMGLNGAKPIGESILTLDERVALVTNGKNLMTPFAGILSEDEIKAVSEYSMIIGKE